MSVDWTLTMIVLAGLPAALTIVAPRRRLRLFMALAFVSPAILYVAVILFELSTRPVEPGALGLAASGFALLSAVLIAPWSLVSLISFGIGLLARRLLRPGQKAGRADGVDPPPPGAA